MSEQHRLHVRTVFARAADLRGLERAAFLDSACRDEPDLRAEVERLLAYDSRFGIDADDDGYLTSPIERAHDGTPHGSTSRLPRYEAGPAIKIGRYRIIGLHGEGGMGTVYEAEQDSPRRTVALKVIRPGLVSPELLHRFSHEAQVLARLQHPGIAQVYEAGMGDDGQPFFVMEFIRGMPMDEYAHSRGLSALARLELLAKVCDAVQHAHDKGVIHRDLKPSNILVDPSGQPKVLDFGIAHVTDADLLTTSSRTRTGQLLGTLSYMSPEQLAARPGELDGRSDGYALGVILFELLAGRLPYDLDKLPVHEVARVIQQHEPSRLGAIDALYRGDIEIIVAKSLEKDKTRRYSSAGDLALDIRRYLAGEAILARPASAFYQLRKFTRRHRALVVGASGIVAALLMGTVVSIIFALRAADNARAAAENARMANEREHDATFQSYRARIAGAVAALSRHDIVDAARALDAAPEAFRDWEWRHLRTRLDDSTTVLRAAAGEVQLLIRDSREIRIASLTPAGLRLTDLEGIELFSHSFPRDNQLLRHPLIPTRRGLRLAVIDQGSLTPAPSPNRTTGVVNLLDDNGHSQTQLKGPSGMEADQVAVSPDGSRLAIHWGDPKKSALALYDPNSGNTTATWTREIGDTWNLAFSPDGTRLATAGEDGVTRLWDTSAGALVAECRGHNRKVLCAAFSPNGRRLATTSSDGTVRQWDSATGLEVESPYDRHIGDVLTAEYSPDGLWIASGGSDRTIRIWGAANRRDSAVLHGHTGVVTDLVFTADGRRLASASQSGRRNATYDATIRLWEVSQNADTSVLRGHTSYIYPVAWSRDGQWIASGGWDDTVRLWDAMTGESCATLRHPGVVRALAFSPDSSWLASECWADESLRIWNIETSQLSRAFRQPGKVVAMAVAVSPDGANIAVADAAGTVKIVQAATGAEVHAFRTAPAEVKRSLAYSPNGRLLAGAGEDGRQIDIWDTRHCDRLARLAGHSGLVASAEFSRDGRFLASASEDHTVRVWDVAAAKCVALLTGHTDSVFTAVFHPDGKRLASAGRDQAIWLWDLATGQEVARLEGHTDYVFSLAFSPDGHALASGSGDGTVRIWDTESPAVRHQARRQAEALRPEAERLVARLFTELNEPAQVVARLRADASSSDILRHFAAREVMRRGHPATP